jgi:hypothetical protein
MPDQAGWPELRKRLRHSAGCGAGGFDRWPFRGRRGCALSQQRLEFGESLLNRVEIRAVGRQEEQPPSRLSIASLDAGDLVAGQIVHDDGIARAQRRREDLPDIGAEDVAGQGAVQHVRGGDAGGAQVGQGDGLPVAVGAPEPAGAGRTGRAVGPRKVPARRR